MKDEDKNWILNDDDTLTAKFDKEHTNHTVFKFKETYDVCQRCWRRLAVKNYLCDNCKSTVDELELCEKEKRKQQAEDKKQKLLK